jgi:hypothetical protein
MAELPKPTATRREEPSRGDSRTRVPASPDGRGAVDDALLARGYLAEAAPDRAARQVVLALVSQVSALPAPHLARRTGVR